jgi:glycosyltransferase involved in cell wall biosynthesis
MQPLTVVIPTHERRAAVEQLTRELKTQLTREPELAEGFEVVVVVDGSTDGSVELLESLEFPAPLKVMWQRPRGRAAARNAGLEVVNGDVVWFLDDDLVPLPGLVRRHRMSHDDEDNHILVGPAPLIPGGSTAAPNQRWFDHIYREMAETGVVDRADRFSLANTSGPVDMFRSVGGFDEGFTGWGCEDVELGYRLLSAGYEVRFDPEALADHQRDLSLTQFCANNVSNGRNLVRALGLHPELVEQLLPVEATVPSRRFAKTAAAAAYRWLPVRSALLYRLLASVAASAAKVEAAATRRQGQRALYVAMVMSTLAGIAEADPSGILLARKFGIVEPS